MTPLKIFWVTDNGFLPTLSRESLGAQHVQPDTRLRRIQSPLASSASRTSSFPKAPAIVKFVPGPSRTFTSRVTRYQFPATSPGGGGGGGGVFGTSVRNWAEDQPVSPSLRRTFLQVPSGLTPMAVTTSFNSSKPSDVNSVPGPERM